jgi:hypothetical protein
MMALLAICSSYDRNAPPRRVGSTTARKTLDLPTAQMSVGNGARVMSAGTSVFLTDRLSARLWHVSRSTRP